MHGPLKDSYDLRTNFKDIAAQVGVIFSNNFLFIL